MTILDHACCTAKMGKDGDGEYRGNPLHGILLIILLRCCVETAVLDGQFRVRGVSNLRVVDLSIWPTIPG